MCLAVPGRVVEIMDDGDIAFRQHSGGHSPAPNWPTFITFASRYLQAPPTGASLPAKH